jgi:ankyrin repeat protein
MIYAKENVMKRARTTSFVLAMVLSLTLGYAGEELRTAARTGELATVKKLVAGGADVNTIYGKNKWTAVMEASENGHAAVVTYLLSKGADPNLKNVANWTALLYGVQKGHLGAVKVLVQGKADLDVQIDYGNDKNWTPLLEALKTSKEKIALALINGGANPNLCTSKGFSPLMWAANRGLVDAVKLLLTKGAKIDHVNKSTQTALIQAAGKNQAAVVTILLAKGADKTVKNFMNATALDVAKRYKYTEVIKLLE